MVVWLLRRPGNLSLVSFYPPVSMVVRLFLSVLLSLLLSNRVGNVDFNMLGEAICRCILSDCMK